MAGLVELSDLVKHRLAGGGAPATYQPFVRRDFRAMVWPFDHGLLRRVLIVLELERGSPDRRFEAAELSFHGFPKVLQQVEAIRDLSRLWRTLACGVGIKTSPIAADNLDLRMLLEPVSRGSGRAIRQQLHPLTTLQVHDDRPEIRAFPPSPFIDAGDTDQGRVGLRSNAFLHAPQDRGVAHRHAEPAHQSLGGSPTRAVAKQLDDSGQPAGLACVWGCEPCKSLGEDPAIAAIVPASPAGQPRLDIHRPPLSGKIPQRP